MKKQGTLAYEEIGNALYAAIKRGRITVDDALIVYREFQRIPLRLLGVDMEESIRLAATHRVPAYDAYYLYCAATYQRPLLTLDRRMQAAAEAGGCTAQPKRHHSASCLPGCGMELVGDLSVGACAGSETHAQRAGIHVA